MNRSAAGEVLDVFERVYHARVGATQEHHKALRGIEEQGLIIQERIGPGAGGVEKEAAAGVFKVRSARGISPVTKMPSKTSVGLPVQTTPAAALRMASALAASIPMGRPVPSGLPANFG